MRHTTSILFIASFVITLSSCRKDKDDPIDLDYTSASDNSRAEVVFNDMLFRLIMQLTRTV